MHAPRSLASARTAQPRLCEAPEAAWSDAWRRGKGMSIGSGLSDRLANVDEDAVRRAAQALSAPTWDEIGSLLPEAERLLEAERASGRGPTDVAADLRLFDLPDGATPRVTLWRDQSAWCPYCQKVILQLEEKRVPYAVRRAPMKCCSMVKVAAWQCPGSAPEPPQDAPGGSG